MDSAPSKKREINWLKVLFQLEVNTSLLFAIGYLFKYGCLWKTFIYAVLLVLLGVLGEFAGSHRLWAHRSYRASTGLKIFLMLCQTTVGHGSIYDWVRWHRLHHKHQGTDLDPYNAERGFFHSHFVALMRDLSPAQQVAMKDIDVRDLEDDKIVMFQKKWYAVLFGLFVILLPINAPCEYWGESVMTSFMIVGLLKAALALHLTWLLHSAVHIWDLKPGEKFPADTNLVFVITKTYWISYHYLAPWDYRTGEYGKYGTDCVTKFIKVCEALGWADGLRTADSRSVRSALAKSVTKGGGDGGGSVADCLAEYGGGGDGGLSASRLCCS